MNLMFDMDIQRSEVQEKFDAAHTLFLTEATSLEQFEAIRKLIQGFDARIDKKLQLVAKAFSAYNKLAAGDVITLTAEHLPEKTDKDKKRKKALLFFIQSLSQLKSEVERVRQELQNNSHQSPQQKTFHVGKIIKYAKGPFGMITIIAVIIVGIAGFQHLSQKKTSEFPTISQATPTPKATIHAIIYKDKKIPLTELRIGNGPDCGTGGIPHYHASSDNEIARAVDGTLLKDPGGCGFGKVNEVQVIVVE